MADSTTEVSCNSCSVTMSTQDENLETTVTPECRLCLVGEEVAQNQQLIEALQTLKMTFTESETGVEYLSLDEEDDQQETVFVLQEFEGHIYTKLQRSGARIMGPTVFCKSAAQSEALQFSNRPLYCSHMAQLIICFTGFTQKEELKRLADLVHHMGGSIRKDFSSRVTHLVANATSGNKYRTAVSLGTPIMTQEWIHKTWEKRTDIETSATSEDMLIHKMPPFFKCVLSFMGFSDDEKKHMEESTISQGGSYASAGDESCTHLVVDETLATNIFDFSTDSLKVVKQEWFWASIQMDACADESLYAYSLLATTPATPCSASKLHLTPTTHSGGLLRSNRKRRRLRESIAALSQEHALHDSPVVPRKRRSSVHDPNATTVSVSSILDATSTPESVATAGYQDCTPMQVDKTPVSSAPAKPLSKRHMVAMELLQTETNYVGILHTIIAVFKEPLEQEQTGGPILDQEDMKTIFGKLPDIHDVHSRLKEDLETLLSNFTEDKCIGLIIQKHAGDMMKAYPPFVNFFDFAKQTVDKCDKQKPRFHAFLKICQGKPECGRQTLTELLIRPVQRLPSMILLLTDLAKRTETSHPDKGHLDVALESLKTVTQHINEDRRKTEGHTQMFDIINDIEGVPPHLLSAHRSFITRVDTIEIGDRESKKGDNFSEKGACVSMFLFSDTLEICKRRGKYGTSFKSPHHNLKTPQKCYKHIELLPLSHIRRILDVNDTLECQNTFCLLCKPPMDNRQRDDRVFMFKMIGDESNKIEWLKTLSHHMANITCKADAENFLVKIEPEELEITKSDFESSTLQRAKRVARRATRKVGRTFSFNKTPRSTLSRAVSTMSVASPMESSTETPRSEDSKKTAARLASISASTTDLSVMSPVTNNVTNKPPITPKRLRSMTIGTSGVSWF